MPCSCPNRSQTGSARQCTDGRARLWPHAIDLPRVGRDYFLSDSLVGYLFCESLYYYAKYRE
jgi:hypothetical protein